MTPLEQKLQQLSLTAMSRQLEKTLAEAATRNLSVTATLEALADLELEARRQRAIERRFHLSRLQIQLSIDSFDFHHHKSPLQIKSRVLHPRSPFWIPCSISAPIICSCSNGWNTAPAWSS